MRECDRPGCPGGQAGERGFCVTCGHRTAPAPGPSTAAGPWWGRALVPVGEADEPEPRLLHDPRVPLAGMLCPHCGGAVTRTAPDRGWCGLCRTESGFGPSLSPGDVVDGRYVVEGVLSHGGFGWAYRARDTQLSRRVVLKGVISKQVAETLERERAHLDRLENPYIVRILGYVSDGHYLVLEYAGGRTLHPVPVTEPLGPVLVAGLDILEALTYLHGEGFLHCDVKPANIVRGRDHVRLIDFGAVRRIGDQSPATTFTKEFCPPPDDPERVSPGVGFDLYCVGTTLRELCRPHLEFHQGKLWTQALSLLLHRATHRDPGRRFSSARQFAEQLSGVIRLVAGQPVTHRSVLFGPMAEALDGGLGEVVPLERWITASVASPGAVRLGGAPFGCPELAQAAAALPAALSDRWDTPAWRPVAPADWQTRWESGKEKLAAGDVAGAARAFGVVRALVPGELMPLLALGLCAEFQENTYAALAFYQTASEADESLVAAHFGLARVLLADARRAEAASALHRVPGESRFERKARVAVVRSLAMVVKAGGGELPPALADVARARGLARDLDLDEFSTALLELELRAAEAAGANLAGPLGDEARTRQEAALRELARFASSGNAHTALIDLANAIRPVTIWSW